MKIAIGADSAGKPLLDVIAAHLGGRSDVEVVDLSQSGFYADLAQNLA
ncbi:MAG: ribose-5-phosphate isomerase, partial [Ensifer adhaerens]